MELEVTYDAEADAAYIDLGQGRVIPSTRQITLDLELKDGVTIVIDVNQEHFIVGLEIIGARSAFYADVLDSMDEIDDTFD